MKAKASSTCADILNILSDGKVHTLQQIAEEVEVSKSTIYRHIQALSYRYPIETFCGGDNKGGVYLDKTYIHQGKILTDNELQLIVQGLTLLQEQQPENLDVIQKLIKEYTPTHQQEVNECYENEHDN